MTSVSIESRWRSCCYLDPELKKVFKKKWKGSLSFFLELAIKAYLSGEFKPIKKGQFPIEYKKASEL